MNKLKELRTKRELTQQDLADYLQIGRSTYAQYELGSREPDFDMIKKIASFYNVSIDYLLDYSKEVPYAFNRTKNKIIEEIAPGVTVQFEDSTKDVDKKIKAMRSILEILEDDNNE